MAEEIEVKTVETTEAVEEVKTEATTENKKESGRNSRRPRRDNHRQEKVSDGLEKRMVHLNPITKVTKGGKTMRYDALMVVGDKNGKVGVGLAKANDVTNAIEKAQQKIESNNYGIRKNLLEYDQVNNDQREIIYAERLRVLNGESMRDVIYKMITDRVEASVDTCISTEITKAEWDLKELNLFRDQVTNNAHSSLELVLYF